MNTFMEIVEDISMYVAPKSSLIGEDKDRYTCYEDIGDNLVAIPFFRDSEKNVVLVSNDIIKSWGVDNDFVLEVAANNALSKNLGVFDMEEVLSSIGGEYAKVVDDFADSNLESYYIVTSLSSSVPEFYKLYKGSFFSEFSELGDSENEVVFVPCYFPKSRSFYLAITNPQHPIEEYEKRMETVLNDTYEYMGLQNKYTKEQKQLFSEYKPFSKQISISADIDFGWRT